MKIKKEDYLADPGFIRLYGSLEAYIEEQRRCGLVAIEKAVRANPLAPQVIVETPQLFETMKPVETSPEGRPSRFSTRGRGVFSKLSLKIYRLYKQ